MSSVRADGSSGRMNMSSVSSNMPGVRADGSCVSDDMSSDGVDGYWVSFDKLFGEMYRPTAHCLLPTAPSVSQKHLLGFHAQFAAQLYEIHSTGEVIEIKRIFT